MRKLPALLALMIALTGAACAQETAPTDRGEVHAVVDMLFAAAAGTTHELETNARGQLTEEELRLRDAQGAAYRRTTLPWLLEAFRVEREEEPLAQPTPSPAPDGEEIPASVPAPMLEAAYAAFGDNPLGATYVSVLAGYGATDALSAMEVTRAMCALWLAEIDHETLAAQNPDYACWIYAAGMPIDYPIVHCDNNDFYLDHLFDGRRNASGTLFADYRNLPEFQDPNTLIYGHHMRNKSMFGRLDEYDEQAFFEGYPYMLLITPQDVYVAELFSAYTTDSSDHCYDIAISDEEDMRVFVEQAERKSDFTTELEILQDDHLVTLSTCAYAFENARYIVIGRLMTAQTMIERLEQGDGV